MATTPHQSVLREFCPLYYLLNTIPAKIQKGFRSVVVYLTALDSSKDYLAVGSSIGMLYLYCRQRSHMTKYNMEGKGEAITAVKLLSCFEDLVAVGTASGRVSVFQLVSSLPGRNKQLRRFDVLDLHKSMVTALAWSANGMKLFSGDSKGRVVYSALDFDQGECHPAPLVDEPCSIVQLDYSHMTLLVSTVQRTLLLHPLEERVQQLGSSRSSGRFGACFLPALCKQSDLQLFAAQPGLQLCRADVHGLVEDTRLLQDLISKEVPQFQLFPRASPAGAYRPAQRQLGLLSCSCREGWLLSWNEYSVLVVDWTSQVVVGALDSCGDIVAVSCCENEIFILKGDRDIIRLSTCPEGRSSTLSELSCRSSTALLPSSGLVETAQPIRTLLLGQQDGGEEVEEGEEVAEQPSLSNRGSVTSCDSIHVTSCDSAHSTGATSCSSEVSEGSSVDYSATSGQEELQQQLVVKAIKVKKKKKRERQDSCCGNRLSDSSWSESMSVVQDDGSGAGSSGDHALLLCRNSPPHDQNQDRTVPESGQSSALVALQDLQNSDLDPLPVAEGLVLPTTPDIDLLLECTFSYMQNSEDVQPVEPQEEEFLSPLIGPEDEEEDMMPPSGEADLLYDRAPSMCSEEEEEEDIYGYGASSSGSMGENLSPRSLDTDKQMLQENCKVRSEQLAESWMGYSGPGCGILNLQVTDRYVWCLDFKGALFCSALPEGGLNWQHFEDNVHQVALSPSGLLLWKVEQKSQTAFACGKVSLTGKRHWYKAVEQTAFVALSDSSAWIIKTNGELHLQTGLSVDRPCARSVKVDCPCTFSQVCARGGVVWALSDQGGAFYREGVNAFCSEGEVWKNDKISEAQGLQLVCLALGSGGVIWALDSSGSLWFRTGISATAPQGDDAHWWQISITDYVVFDQGSLFQTLLQASHSVASVTKAPVEKMAECLRVAFLSQNAQQQPSLVSANASGVWVASGRNGLHVARGSLVGTFWQEVVPRGTLSTTRWSYITSSAGAQRAGTFLWLAQSRKDLFCIWDQDGEMRPSSITLPAEVELVQLSACIDALWGLDVQGCVHIRTLSSSCPIGMHWTRLDLSQLGGVRLLSVSCGTQNVWAVDAHGMVYFRVGTQPLNPSMMLPAWICIEPPVQPAGVQLLSIHSSPNDRILWVLDSRGSVHVRTGLSEEMPVGTDWEQVPGLVASQLVLSFRSVWVRCPNGEIARRYGNSRRNPAGDYWKKIPGRAQWLTVSPEDELWAVTPSGCLCRRLTKPLRRRPAKLRPSSSTDQEDEWEVI